MENSEDMVGETEGTIEIMRKQLNEMEEVNKMHAKLYEAMEMMNEQLEKVVKELNSKLEDDRSELDYLKAMNSALVAKESQNNYEIQEARKELIKVFRDLSCGGSTVGVKRLGAVDEKPFLKACQQRFSGEVVHVEHDILVSKWENGHVLFGIAAT